MEFERHCDLIVEQAELLAGHLTEGTDLGTAVPSCPGWNVGQLVRHVGGAHREATVVARTGETPPDDEFREPTRWYADPSDRTVTAVRELAGWIVDGARELAEALRTAGPDVPIHMPIDEPTTRFTARRMAHETVMHRADAALALGAAYELDPEVATDGIDEWMELGALPLHFEVHPWMRELLAPGRTLRFAAPEQSWVVDLTGDAIRWRHSVEPTAVTVRGPLTDLLLHLYKRRDNSIEVEGDRDLLDYYRERVSFG
ncbi:maleylpyruvate isomerase family mycothiol-dependent enzyme [Kribbella speibonae]|uniref:Maleylpyruvate isomerase family mycothiol-dependent enzyme n=1 Tax=Kribbella speibonae TaxID=1572660 RepID=A0A4R0IXS1_9ACTN|nr:maleylpyruvate isomerase family mycothiol-dependent enzyme [Kribbella speibonae]TCC38833.1 maleylpyruvate isomerase family mycothiol-dependent enzyme [Kribbella speibonae]